MSRRRTAKSTGVQLFTFLDVMICTMGALLVLLHGFARHGDTEAERVAQAAQREQAEQDAIDADFFRWRSTHLREARTKTQADLDAERLKLSHIEDHQRRLEEKLAELKIAAEELEKASRAKAGKQSQNEAELAELQDEIARVRTAIASAPKNGKSQAVNYSVMPYDGRHGTHRRPIYIECRAHKIVLQPEGVEITPSDFLGHFGPGNPLSTALRAQREFMARQSPTGSLDQEPYPLLLVRPDGIDAYWAARRAFDSSGSEFGYELVGGDWDLSFPPADERLKMVTAAVVAESSRRIATYLAASPQFQRMRSRTVYHVNSQHGVQQQTDDSRGAGRSIWTDPFQATYDGGSGGAPDGFPATSGGRPNGDVQGAVLDGDPNGALGSSVGMQQGNRPPGSGMPNADATGTAATAAGMAGANANKPGSADANQTGAGTTNYHLLAGNAQHGAGGMQDGDKFERDAAQPGGAGGLRAEDGLQGTADGDSMTPSDMPALGKRGTGRPQSIAATRGSGWGVNSQIGTVGAARPVLIRCTADKLQIVSDTPGQSPQEIPLQSSTEEAMDRLISSIWRQARNWGTAGRGMYWKPTLVIEVLPGGEQRFHDIQALLADSGLEVQRRGDRPSGRQAGSVPPLK